MNISEYCELLGCSQKCEKTNNTYRCLCDEEFRLDDDNKTCIEKGMQKILNFPFKWHIVKQSWITTFDSEEKFGSVP